jgi:hypothetical protein
MAHGSYEFCSAVIGKDYTMDYFFPLVAKIFRKITYKEKEMLSFKEIEAIVAEHMTRFQFQRWGRPFVFSKGVLGTVIRDEYGSREDKSYMYQPKKLMGQDYPPPALYRLKVRTENICSPWCLLPLVSTESIVEVPAAPVKIYSSIL